LLAHSRQDAGDPHAGCVRSGGYPVFFSALKS
jgi:hypothetical protein